MKKSKFQPYKSKKNGKWYFRLRGKNGKKVATGNEAFERRPTIEHLNMLKRIINEAIYDWKDKKKKAA